MADGSIIIDSRMNNKGAYAELKALQAKAKSTAQQISGLDKQIGKLENKHTTLGEDLKQARQEAAATTREYYNLANALDANRNRGVGNDPADEKRADTLLKQMEGQLAKVGEISAEYRQQNAEITNLQQRHAELTGQLAQEQEAANGAADALARQDAAADAAGRASKAMRRAANSVHSLGAKLKAVSAQINRASKSMHHFGARLKNIVLGALVFNLVSASLRTMVNGLGNAISKTDGVNSALARLKGAASTAAAGLASALAPAITWVLNLLTALINGFVRLISLLTGKSVASMKQAAKNMSSVGSAAGSTAKQVEKASRSLAGFDEIERLDAPQTGSSGGGGGSATPNYDFASSGYGFVDSIIDVIKAGDWEGVGQILAQKMNDVVNNFDAFAWGEKIGAALQHGIDVASEFIRNVNWNNIGYKIADFLNSAMEQIDGADIGEILAAKFTIGIRAVGGFLERFDWSLLARKVSAGFIQALQSVGDAIASVDWFAIGAGISAGIRSIDFSGIAEAVGYLIRQAFKAGVELVAGAGADMWGWLKSTFLDGFNEVFGDTDAWGPFGQNIVTGMLNGVLHVIAGIGSWIWNNIFKPFWDGISGAFDMHSPSRVAEGWGENIGIGMLNGLTLAWKKITGFIDKMKQGFSQGWQSIKSNTESVFRDLASALGGIWNGITSVIRGSVNSIISAINGMIRGVCDGLNSVIRSMNSLHFDIPDWVPGLGGKSFGFDIGTLTAPQIPYLAQGAVIPANREFLAVLGDQSHGTNVEAPLATIQQAVAEVMEDVQAGQMAGFETLAELLRQLISAVYGIELTDEQVGRAAQRWQRHQEIMMGGAF